MSIIEARVAVDQLIIRAATLNQDKITVVLACQCTVLTGNAAAKLLVEGLSDMPSKSSLIGFSLNSIDGAT